MAVSDNILFQQFDPGDSSVGSWLSGAEPSAEAPQQALRMLNQVNLAVTTEQYTTVPRIFN